MLRHTYDQGGSRASCTSVSCIAMKPVLDRPPCLR